MSKYKVGDKVVFTITETTEEELKEFYSLSNSFCLRRESIDYHAELLSKYTEPLEAKIKRQAAEITRLLRENKELKNEKQELTRERNQLMGRCGGLSAAKIKAFNNGRLAGCNEAWELARKGMLMSSTDREAVFGSGCNAMYGVLVYHTYQEAAAKVAEWEKAKEIKVGDVIRDKCDTSSKFCVTQIDYCDGQLYGVGRYGLTYSNQDPEYWEKTGRHIDIDGFLKQIGGGDDEK